MFLLGFSLFVTFDLEIKVFTREFHVISGEPEPGLKTSSRLGFSINMFLISSTWTGLYFFFIESRLKIRNYFGKIPPNTKYLFASVIDYTIRKNTTQR